jgi:hypothetical protein
MSDIQLMNVETIIEKAGGVGKLAALLSVRHPTVCDWRRTGYVPGGRVIEISQKLNLDVTEVSKLITSATTRLHAVRSEAA